MSNRNINHSVNWFFGFPNKHDVYITISSLDSVKKLSNQYEELLVIYTNDGWVTIYEESYNLAKCSKIHFKTMSSDVIEFALALKNENETRWLNNYQRNYRLMITRDLNDNLDFCVNNECWGCPVCYAWHEHSEEDEW